MSTPRLEIDRQTADGRVVLRLSGNCLLADGDRLWSAVQKEVGKGPDLRLDLTAVGTIDGACVALLQSLRITDGCAEPAFEIVGADAEAQRLIGLYDTCAPGGVEVPAAQPIGLKDQVGRAAVDMVHVLRDVFAFVGDMSHSVMKATRESRSVNWAVVPRLMERAGADGVPIILLINFLVGLIIALQAAFQLERFGANIFIADLVGLSMVREMAPLMTAIVVAGRSGAAYAAELGTMKVNQEVDALRTLGFDPQRFLVLPRLLALGLVMPMLTAVSMVVGIFGGLIIGVQYLGLTTLAFMVELQSAVGFVDVASGLFKSGVFAVTIAFVACQRGLSTRGGAAEVGSSTTSAVVVVLFFLVVLDAIFTLLFNLFGI